MIEIVTEGDELVVLPLDLSGHVIWKLSLCRSAVQVTVFLISAATRAVLRANTHCLTHKNN